MPPVNGLCIKTDTYTKDGKMPVFNHVGPLLIELLLIFCLPFLQALHEQIIAIGGP